MYVTKKLAVWGLPLENLLLNVFCQLSLNSSGVVWYIQCDVQTEQFRLFQIKLEDPSPKYFLLSFNGTPHPLGSIIAGQLQQYRLCASASLCQDSYAVIHHMMQRHFWLTLRETAQIRELVRFRMIDTAVKYHCMCCTRKVHAQCAQGMCFFGTLVCYMYIVPCMQRDMCVIQPGLVLCLYTALVYIVYCAFLPQFLDTDNFLVNPSVLKQLLEQKK